MIHVCEWDELINKRLKILKTYAVISFDNKAHNGYAANARLGQPSAAER